MEYLIRSIKRSSNILGNASQLVDVLLCSECTLKYEHVLGMSHHLEIPSTSKYLGHPHFHYKKNNH